MKKTTKTVNAVSASKTAHPSSSEPTPVVAAAPAAAPPSPSVVTAIADPVVQECTAHLDQVLAKLGNQAPLDLNEVRRATKMRKGGAEVIPKILALCLQHNLTQIGTLTTQEMSDELKRGDALVQVGLRSALVQKKVKESAMAAHGRSWQIGTTMYITLQRLAKNDPELALGLADVESFFQTKRTKGKVRANKKASASKKAAKAAGATATVPVVAAPPPATAAPQPVATNNGHGGPDVSVADGAPAAAPPAPVNGAAH
jgi:hypothetical protein